jgi:hypothetical protein
MKWHLGNDYHNSRAYDDEPPNGVVVGQAQLTIAWLLDAGRRQFERLLKPKPSAPETILLTPGDMHGFTVLGAAIAHHAVHESALTCPFPELDGDAGERRSMLRAASVQDNKRTLPADGHAAHSSER